MKKRLLLLLVVIPCLVSACAPSAADKAAAIAEANQNTNLPFALTMAERDLEYGDEFQPGGGWGGYTLEKEGLLFWLAGWPDVQDTLDGYLVTEYHITGKEYHVFGIYVGDTVEDAVSVLTEYGYARDEEEEAWYGSGCYLFKKSDAVRVTLFSFDDKAINEIRFYAIQTNKENVVF